MKYIKEQSLKNFEPWCGARFTHERLIENGDIYSVEELIESGIFGEEIPTETQINDLLWLETDMIAEYLGYEDWETYCTKRKEDRA